MAGRQARIPRLVGWGITNRCNLSCPHCYSSASKRAGGELSTRECLDVIDALAAMGAERIGWTGGEPLLRTDLELLVARAAARGITSGLTTNGVPMTPRRARSLKDAGLTAVQISIDGSTSERNARIRRASTAEFERALRAVSLCREADLVVHMAMLAGAETLDDIRATVDLGAHLGVASIRLCGFVPGGRAKLGEARGRLDLAGSLPALVALIEELQERRSPEVLFDPAFGPLPPDFLSHECIAGVEMLYISPPGDVYPCTSLLDERFRVGSLRERSLAELWADPAMSEIASYPPERIAGPCRDCAHLAGCRGGCRGIAYASTGDLDASLPICLARAGASGPRPSPPAPGVSPEAPPPL